MGRVGQPSEVADAVLWLFSDRTSFVTGETLMLDGGYIVQQENFRAEIGILAAITRSITNFPLPKF
jgi:enoyl-[acyl-carrier-protein] reductase (NADH)